MYDRAISAPTSPTRLSHSGRRSWEEPNWMGSPRLLNKDMKTGLSRSLQTLPTDSSAFDTGEKACRPLRALSTAPAFSKQFLSARVPGIVLALAFCAEPVFPGLRQPRAG